MIVGTKRKKNYAECWVSASGMGAVWAGSWEGDELDELLTQSIKGEWSV